MNEERIYEEGEAEEILRRAVHDTHTGAIDHERLLSMAAELGISESAIARAEADIQMEKVANESALSEQQIRREYRKWRKSRFWRDDLSSAVMASLVFTALWYFTGQGYFWPGWVIGIATMVTIFNLFGEVLMFSESDYQRWKSKRDRKASKAGEDGSDESSD